MDPQNQPPIVPAPTPRKFFNWKVILVLVGVLITIGIAALYSYGIYLNHQTLKPFEPHYDAERDCYWIASDVCGRAVQDNIDVADWQTYRNEKYGFEFRYPKSTVKPPQVIRNGEIIEFNYYGEMYNDYLTSFKIVILDNDSQQDLRSWFSQNVDYNDSLIKNGVFKLSAVNGGEVMSETNKPIPSEYSNSDTGPITYGAIAMPTNKTYIVTINRGQEAGIDHTNLNLLISTFKFTK